MPAAFFVYGTLKRGEINHRLLAPYLVSVEAARLAGSLYDVGEFPALLQGDGTVHGDLIRIDPDRLPDLLPVLDRLEECIPDDDEASLYHRRVVTVTTESGVGETAFVYFYNSAHPYLPPPERLDRVPDGRWSGTNSIGPSGSEELDTYRRRVREYADSVTEP